MVGPPADTMNYRASSPPATTSSWYVEDLFSVVTGSRGARVIAQPHSLDKAASPAAAGGGPDK